MTFPEALAEWAVALGPESREARAEAKLSFADTRACIAAGDRTEQYTIVVTLFEGTKLSESVARVHRM